MKEGLLRMAVGGSIVNISSVHAMMTSSRVGPYAAAKAALLSLTRTAAIEGREKNIRANAIVPGAIDTPMLHDNPNVSSGAEKLDAGEIGMPVDIANATLFLVSDEASFITGSSLIVDGGRLARL
jgi:NAD(P)-dependent dehydrogenase (short-subunit alcohol dehydrogenase family)